MNKNLGDTRGCPLNFLRLREHNASKLGWGSYSASTSFLSRRLDLVNNLYRRDLFAHYGCVNAIEFSQDGYWLISGGDDRRVLLWNLESSMAGHCKPLAMKEEHSSNIFCLGFDSQNSKIFSAGNDEQVIVHDVKTRETVNVFMHEEAIYSVSVNPYVDSVFASAGEDGQILIFDIRAPSSAEPLLLARSYDAFHAVQFHPVEPMFVVTANSKEGVVLWDVRKPRLPFVKYGEKRSSESSMCARFNSSGTQIIALRRRMHPILFNTDLSTPVCEFDADLYYNSCTMKSCCFAGSRDQFVLSGSDDFNLYMWRIPDPDSNITFIPETHLILKGHRSIVNQVRFNVHNFTIASSGVEKIIKLWSPVAVPGSHGAISGDNIDSYMTRRVYTHEDYIGLVLDSGQTVVSHDYSHGNTDEDPKMMAFFDSLVQREVEGWTTNSDLSDEDLQVSFNAVQSSPSVASSQSDTDSENTWMSPRMRARRNRLHLRSQRDGDNSAADEERRKTAQGSDWILKLIAKKRAQLKAAKKKKKSLKKKQKSKARQFIRCFTSSRQYLYRPENNRASTSNRSNRASPADLLRRRHSVAPYTMMSIGHLEESDEESEEDASTNQEMSPSLFRPHVIVPTSQETILSSSTSNLDRKKNTCEIRFWSSGNSTTEDEGINENSEGDRKKKKCNINCPSSSSLLSDLIESDDSTIKGAISVNTSSSDLSFSSKYSLRTNLKARSGKANCAIGNANDNTVSSDQSREMTSQNRNAVDVRNIMPISGISTDEAGSVLFVSNELGFFNRNEELEQDYSSRENSICNSNSLIHSKDSNNHDDVNSNRSSSDINFPSNLEGEKPVYNPLRKKRARSNSSEFSSQFNSGKRFQSRINDLLDSNNCLSLCGGDDNDDDIQLPTTPDDRVTSCDETTGGITYGVNASTPDSGISVSDRGDKSVEDSSSELDRKDSKPSFKKKKIPEYRMKSYRSRSNDEGEDKE